MSKAFLRRIKIFFVLPTLLFMMSCEKNEDENAVPAMSGFWRVDSIKSMHYNADTLMWGTVTTTSPHSLDFSIPFKLIETYLNRKDTLPFMYINDSLAVTDMNKDTFMDTVALRFKKPTELYWVLGQKNSYHTRHTYFLSKVK